MLRLLVSSVAVGLALAGQAAVHAQVCVPAAAAAAPEAHLNIKLDQDGNAVAVILSGYLPRPGKVAYDRLEQALAEALGVSLQDIVHSKNPYRLLLQARARTGFTVSGSTTTGTLNLAPLAAQLRPLGFASLNIGVLDDKGRHAVAEDERHMVGSVIKSATADPAPISFRIGPERTALLRVGVLLGGLLLIPIFILFWLRRLALRTRDETLARYRLWRGINVIVAATWLAWFTAISALDVADLLEDAFGYQLTVSEALACALSVLPPWMMALMGNGLAQTVFSRLHPSEKNSSGDLRRSLQVALITLVPWLPALAGLYAVWQRQFLPAACWIALAVGLRMLLSRLWQDQSAPSPLGPGPLRSRIFQLARAAGVSLRQAYLVPSGGVPQANAFALPGGEIFLTEHLLRNLSAREVDAVVAHELAHVKYNHPAWLLVIFFAAVLAPALLPLSQAAWLEALPWFLDWLAHVPWGLALAMLAVHFASRRFEHQTDEFAARLTGDAAAVISGLVKVHRLNFAPMQWGRWEELLLSHPSTSDRVKAIARKNGIADERLQHILEGAPGPLEHYECL